MYKNPIKFYTIQIVIILFLSIILKGYTPDKVFQSFDTSFVRWEKDWSYYKDSKKIPINDKTSPPQLEAGDVLILENTLPTTQANQFGFAFFSLHQYVNVYIDGNLIYSFGDNANTNFKSPGNAWNFIPLDSYQSGTTIRIELLSNYKDTVNSIPSFYIGNLTSIQKYIIQSGIIPLLICCIMLIIGILTCIVWCVVRYRFNARENFLYLGLFTIALSIWCGIETQILPIFLGKYYFFSQLAFLSLFMMQLPFVKFFSLTYGFEDLPLIKFVIRFGYTIFSIELLLQLFHIMDIRESIFLTHILFAISVITVAYLTIKALLGKKREERLIAWLNICFVTLSGIAIALDTMIFYFKNTIDSARFGRISLLAYVALLAYITLRDSLKLMQVGKEAENIKILAFQDTLTNLKNRAAFMEQLNSIPKEDYEKYGLVMFDLNNVKYFNDQYGHNMGDYYIIVCSEILQDIFGDFSDIYRIGGDEFCCLLKEYSTAEFLLLSEQIDDRINDLGDKYFEGKMQIARGYTKFDRKLDKTLFNTINRADKLMYSNKQRLKEMAQNTNSN